MTSLPECLVDDCNRTGLVVHKGYCGKHNGRARKQEPKRCSIQGCDRKMLARGWCGAHYARWRVSGTTDWPGNRVEYRQPPRDWSPEQVHEARLGRKRQYYSENTLLWEEYSHIRRARKYTNEYETVTTQQVIDTYGTDCHICGGPIDMNAPRSSGAPGWKRGLHIDHVKPLALGGSHTLANCRPSHGLCNVSKGAT